MTAIIRGQETSPIRELLVTGASGFLGREIVRLACDAGWHVRTLERNPRAQAEGIVTFVGDIGDAAVLRKACEGVTAIAHAAGLAHVFGPRTKDPAFFNAVNEQGTSNVLEAAVANGVRHVVLASSVSVYGSYHEGPCDETMPCHPEGPYAISKWRGEISAIERMAQEQGALTILRYATIYGEGDRGNVAKLIGALDRGSFIWPDLGLNRKSLIYKEDAARACLCALEQPDDGTKIYNVSAEPATMREIVTAICKALGRPVPRTGIPTITLLKAARTILYGLGDPGGLGHRLRKFIHDDVYDGAKFEAAYNFFPAVSLSEGMRREVESLRPRTIL